MLPSIDPVGIVNVSNEYVLNTLATIIAQSIASPHSLADDFFTFFQFLGPMYSELLFASFGNATHGRAPKNHCSSVDLFPKTIPSSGNFQSTFIKNVLMFLSKFLLAR